MGISKESFLKMVSFIRLADTASLKKASMLLGTSCFLQQNLSQYRKFQFNIITLITMLL